ncbi:MAG: serine/threonine protein kinase [Deltaproteobacteria bacterium]|nr:serine/threonine protein kinase [Deltaproteobacteria bacterium]
MMDVSVKEGDVLGGTYRVERVIGAGGMAVVVAAIHMFEPERVAIKILYRKAAKSKEVLKRFEREQRTIRQMRSEHVSRLLGAGIFKDSPYMVMELLKGQDLSDMLKSRGALSIEESAGYLLQACEAIAEAHALGTIHRDLKPGNLFLTHRADGSPCIKVLDFGIAKSNDPLRKPEESELTKTTAVFGSPFYMSPEQMISSKDVSASTDIWSIGVILHELLTKTLPFAEKSPDRICARVLNGSPTPLRETKPDYPAALEAIILRCLQRKPADRYKNVTDFALSLAAFAPPWALSSLSRIVAVLPPVEMDLNAIPSVDDEPTYRPALASSVSDEPESPTLYVRPKSSRLPLRKMLIVSAVAAVFASGLFIGMNVRQPAASVDPRATASVSSPAPVACAAPVASEDESADPLKDVPIEMDLDETSPARKQAEKKRAARDAGADPSGLLAQYEASLSQSSGAASARPPASSAPGSASATASPAASSKEPAPAKTPKTTSTSTAPASTSSSGSGSSER